MEGDKLGLDDPSSAPRRSFVVAIPIKNEEERLPACLRALAEQEDCFGKPIAPGSIRLVAFINNSSDGSAALTRSLGASLGIDILVIEATLPLEDAHAGTARGAAMDLAYARLSEPGPAEGVILTTDAGFREIASPVILPPSALAPTRSSAA